jgi:hypothetical protein
MNRFDGTAARQLDLLDAPIPPAGPQSSPQSPEAAANPAAARIRLLQKDVYAELARRRRRAQIRARHLID